MGIGRPGKDGLTSKARKFEGKQEQMREMDFRGRKINLPEDASLLLL